MQNTCTYNFRRCFATAFLRDKLKLLLNDDTLFSLARDNKDLSDDEIFAKMKLSIKQINNEYYNTHKIKYLENVPNMKSSTRVLDFGGANGLIAKAIADKYKMDFVDIADIHDEKTALVDDKIHYKQILKNHLPYKNGEFDVITCFMVLHHIEPNDLSAIINELHRCCNGYLLIQEHDCNNDMKYILDILHGLYMFVYKNNDYEKLNSMSEYHAWYKSASDFDKLFHGKFKLVKRFATNKIQENFVALYKVV